MARRCVLCNRIITEDRKFLSQATLDMLIENGVIDADYEKNQPLPICVECLDNLSDGE